MSGFMGLLFLEDSYELEIPVTQGLDTDDFINSTSLKPRNLASLYNSKG